MSVGQFEPPPRLTTKRVQSRPRPSGNVNKDLQALTDWLAQFEGCVLMTQADEDSLRTWLERYTKKVAAET